MAYNTAAVKEINHRLCDWLYVEAFPSASPESKLRLSSMDTLRADLRLDSKNVSIKNSMRYCVLVTQLAQEISKNQDLTSAVPVLWFDHTGYACNCIWFEVVCKTLDLARRMFAETFQIEDPTTHITTKQRRRLFDRYSALLTLLRFVQQKVYTTWKGHVKVFRHLVDYDKQRCSLFVDYTTAYLAWCGTLLERGRTPFCKLPLEKQTLCLNLSSSAHYLLSRHYSLEHFPDPVQSGVSADEKQATSLLENPYFRGSMQQRMLCYESGAVDESVLRQLAKQQGKMFYHQIMELSMHSNNASAWSVDNSFDMVYNASATASNLTVASHFDDKTMIAVNWTEALVFLPLLDFADHLYSSNDIANAVACYECAVLNRCYLPNWKHLSQLRRALTLASVPRSIEHFYLKRISKIRAPVTDLLNNACESFSQQATVPFELNCKVSDAFHSAYDDQESRALTVDRLSEHNRLTTKEPCLMRPNVQRTKIVVPPIDINASKARHPTAGQEETD